MTRYVMLYFSPVVKKRSGCAKFRNLLQISRSDRENFLDNVLPNYNKMVQLARVAFYYSDKNVQVLLFKNSQFFANVYCTKI